MDMKANWQMFHCLCCGQLLRLEAADKLFQTGFYQASYPLGSCTSCRDAKQASSSGLSTSPGGSGSDPGPSSSPSSLLYGCSILSA
ncbi:hypothetical protein NYE40_06750 [Paenibacillus sp. FSL W8-1187]|uniref:hypothetical protein n=1 Tax=unclassified Paenibacillus TaxID=185978 RepID=UPI00129B632B|nr:hypothetical protein [Paenibacillus sp. B01]QGG55295.1 hypothetical protein GE073_06670 [Paenibacillus sp. B01]